MSKNSYSGTVLSTWLFFVVPTNTVNDEKFHSFVVNNSKEMPTRQLKSSSAVSDKGTPSWHKSKINSFAHLEADDEVLPVNLSVIGLANSVIEKNWEASTLVPFMTVPTRSAGIALDYRPDGVNEIYYRFTDDGIIHVNHRVDKKTVSIKTFSDLSKVPSVTQFITQS